MTKPLWMVVLDADSDAALQGATMELVIEPTRDDRTAVWLTFTRPAAPFGGYLGLTLMGVLPEQVQALLAIPRGTPLRRIAEIRSGAEQGESPTTPTLLTFEFGNSPFLNHPSHIKVTVSGTLHYAVDVRTDGMACPMPEGEDLPLTWGDNQTYLGHTIWYDMPWQWAVQTPSGSRYLVVLVDLDEGHRRERQLFIPLPPVVTVTQADPDAEPGSIHADVLSISDHEAYAAFLFAHDVVLMERYLDAPVAVRLIARNDLPEDYAPSPPEGWAGFDPERFAHPDANKDE
jgi:hypothetical protein